MKHCTTLALDTSSAVTYVAARGSSGDVFQSSSMDVANHSEQLSKLISITLDEASLRAQDLEQLIVGAGPGSFTGLRIGFSFMKGLASAIGRPLVSVSSLAAAAFEFIEPGWLVASVADARRDQVFCQLLWLSRSGALETAGPASIFEVADFWAQTDSTAHNKGFGPNVLAVCADTDLSFLKERNVASPKSVGRSLLELGRKEGGVTSGSHDGVFDVTALAKLEPHYVRAVAAKTIAQRSQ